MADSRPFDAMRLALMQDVLPVGLALLDRARRGGPGRVVESFTTSPEPFSDLRSEGEPAAREVRERLDQVSPGLGNPVMEVAVEVEDMVEEMIEEKGEQELPVSAEDERLALQAALTRIEQRLVQLRQQLAS
ncbi:hypothetical protein SynRS9909_00050 [Synechococcus sp. RS9909]|uniref:hypothetical protein n=1 Tax=unclassified Synechococcus TaxID=2626047 RepID=UPI00006906A8|nr:MULTISPECIES: hypothetical protein [unclassified Synechococcus]EAQ70277.1 hypothetical protein RS9917_05560 [Synechococcus sp. RS9917]QNI78068.1 hypothetical protein SynRS9909_00050 [Synechococcus sp. RS9909]